MRVGMMALLAVAMANEPGGQPSSPAGSCGGPQPWSLWGQGRVPVAWRMPSGPPRDAVLQAYGEGEVAMLLLAGTTSDGFFRQREVVRVAAELAELRAVVVEADGVRPLVDQTRTVTLVLDDRAAEALVFDGEVRLGIVAVPPLDTGLPALDALNARVGVRNMRALVGSNMAAVEFEGQRDAVVLAHAYATVPGVVDATSQGATVDGSTLVRIPRADAVHYVVRRSSGDCFAGCIRHEYTYATFHRATGEVTRDGHLSDVERRSGGRGLWGLPFKPAPGTYADLPALLVELRASQWWPAEQAARALGEMLCRPGPVVALDSALREAVRGEPSMAVDALREAVFHPEPEVREAALDALVWWGGW